MLRLRILNLFTMIATLVVVVLLLEGSAAWSDDTLCLKSFKKSVQDPDGRLEPWNFANTPRGFLCTFVGVSCWNDRESRAIRPCPVRLNGAGRCWKALEGAGRKVFSCVGRCWMALEGVGRRWKKLSSNRTGQGLSIELPNMALGGQFPAASLRGCSSLTTLDLSGNYFSGPIPSDIHLILPFLVNLRLSHNNFTGFIPPSIANMRYLNTLVLDANGLTGPFPHQIALLPRLRRLDVSNNMLSGPLPASYSANDLEINFENNPGLCGHPFEACHTARKQTMPMPPFFHGILTGWAVSMALVFPICLYALPETYVHMLAHWIHNKKKQKKKAQESLLKAQSEMNALKVAKMEKYAAWIPFAELKEATGNFRQENVIGIGMRGKTFKARIHSGWPLAVKRVLDSDGRDREIASEILSLGRLRHPRLLPLIGFCIQKNDMYFVYKYMSNGTLYDWLHLRQGNAGCWPLRFKIAIGIAQGLAWLHKSSSLRVIHGDITSKCILLDKHFEPKISNFWEAKFIHSKHSISVSGFWGVSQGFESDKTDVRLFGIVLLELITGKEPQQLVSSLTNDTSPASLLAFELDRSLIGQGFDEEIHQCLQIAKTCVHPNPTRRPSMSQAYATLAALEQIYSSTTTTGHRVSI